jgi:hypothetical protein
LEPLEERERKVRKFLSHDFFGALVDPAGEFVEDDWEYAVISEMLKGGVDGPDGRSSSYELERWLQSGGEFDDCDFFSPDEFVR